MACGGSRLALVALEGIPPAAIEQAVRSLEALGFEVDVIDQGAADPGAADRYSALAMPAARRRSGPSNPLLAPLIESMNAAGKPVMYVSIPPPDATADGRPSARGFSLRRLLAESWQNWNAIDAPRLGAALAYYGMLSFAPLLVLMVSITGLFFKRTIIQSGLLWQVQVFVGDAGASIVRSVLEHAKVSTGIVAGSIGILVLILGASGVFLELRDSLDTVWGVAPSYGSGLLSLIRARAFAFLLILATGVLLSVAFLLSALLATPARFILRALPAHAYVTEMWTICLSLIVMTIIFALIFRTIPDIEVAWGDVWIGAVVTSVLFNAGRAVIGIYLANASIGSPYAAAGSLILFLTWAYYSAQIFLFGAEFTHAYALRHGSYSKYRPNRRSASTTAGAIARRAPSGRHS